MEIISKYILTFFAIENIMAINRLVGAYATPIFYGILGLGIILILVNFQTIFTSRSITTYKIFYIFILIIWLYQLIFGWAHIHPKTWTYLFSKTVMLLMTIMAVNNYPVFHLRKFYIFVCYVSTILIICGSFVSPIPSTGRLSLGFGNPNGLGSLGAICFGYLFIADKDEISGKIRYLLLFILLIAVLVSGSRAALGTVLLAVIYKYGVSLRLFFVGSLVAIVIFLVLPNYNINFQGIDRFVNTVENQNLSAGREAERAASILMIKNSPWDGNGIYAGQSEEAMRISELGSHNAYLDILKWFGYPFGILLILSIILCAFSNLKAFWDSAVPEFRAHLFVIFAVLIMSFFEGMIHGVNEIINTLFFVSFAVLDYYRTNLDIETKYYIEDSRNNDSR